MDMLQNMINSADDNEIGNGDESVTLSEVREMSEWAMLANPVTRVVLRRAWQWAQSAIRQNAKPNDGQPKSVSTTIMNVAPQIMNVAPQIQNGTNGPSEYFEPNPTRQNPAPSMPVPYLRVPWRNYSNTVSTPPPPFAPRGMYHGLTRANVRGGRIIYRGHTYPGV